MAYLFIDTRASLTGTFKAAVKGAVKSKYALALTNGEKKCSIPLRTDGVPEVFPLTLGDGWYVAQLEENIIANRYRVIQTVGFNVKLIDQRMPWISPSRFVPFEHGSKITELAKALCEGKSTETEKYKAITGYVKGHFVYDHAKAARTRYDYYTIEPDVDRVVDTGFGVCVDLASAVVAMLRSQGIVSKLVYGYIGEGLRKKYHAWTVSIVDGRERMYDPTTDAGCPSYLNVKHTPDKIF